MTKLYFAPGACSLSPHIVLREAGWSFTLEKVDLRKGQTETGIDFKTINPKGYVPALQLDDGVILTEGPAIVQYIADQTPEAKLAPPNGTLERARLQEHLTFIGTEIHKSFSPLFGPNSDEVKAAAVAKVTRRLDQVEAMLADGRQYLLGDQFSAADAYLFVMSSWTKPTGIGLERWPHLAAYAARVAARPAVQAALKAEGLI